MISPLLIVVENLFHINSFTIGVNIKHIIAKGNSIYFISLLFIHVSMYIKLKTIPIVNPILPDDNVIPRIEINTSIDILTLSLSLKYLQYIQLIAKYIT